MLTLINYEFDYLALYYQADVVDEGNHRIKYGQIRLLPAIAHKYDQVTFLVPLEHADLLTPEVQGQLVTHLCTLVQMNSADSNEF